MNYIDKFRDDLLVKDRSDNTIDSYMIDTKQFTRFYESNTDSDVSKAIQLDLVQYKKHLLKKSYKVATINRKLVSVNTFFKYMYDNNYINSNISIDVIEDKDEKDFKGLEDKDAQKLKREIHRFGSKRDICIFELLANTGIRVTELVNIKLDHIDISERKGTLTVIGKGVVKRTLPLNLDARNAIEDYLAVRDDKGNDYLLQGQRGRMTRKGIDTLLKKYGDRLSMDVSAHKLRHTVAYRLINDGNAITTVQKILGHSDINTTLIYTQTTNKDMQDALDNL